MADSEMIDFFAKSNEKEGDFNFEDEVFQPGRSKMNDYKHQSKTIQKGTAGGFTQSAESYSAPAAATIDKKSYLQLNDEKLIWAGAIFVFFGVLLFLVGYWLGKSTIKDMTLSAKQTVQRTEERIEQKRIENSLALTPVTQDNATESANALIENRPIEPSAITPAPEAIRQPAVESISVPPIEKPQVEKKSVSVKPKEGTIRKSATAEKVKKAPVYTASGGEGSFIIQVSAHTSMDKARGVEDGIRKLGLQSYLVEANVNGITYYRVRVGKFVSKEDAQGALSKIKGSSFGRESFIIGLKS